MVVRGCKVCLTFLITWHSYQVPWDYLNHSENYDRATYNIDTLLFFLCVCVCVYKITRLIYYYKYWLTLETWPLTGWTDLSPTRFRACTPVQFITTSYCCPQNCCRLSTFCCNTVPPFSLNFCIRYGKNRVGSSVNEMQYVPPLYKHKKEEYYTIAWHPP
jgi:hypothetical protein